MNNTETTPLLEYAKNYIIDNIERVNPKTVIACPAELVDHIVEFDRENGTILNDEDKSFDTICAWRYEAGEYFDRFKNYPYINKENPFWNPGKFMVKLVAFAINDILYQIDFLNPMYDFRLTAKLRKNILRALDGVKDFSFNHKQ